MPPLHRSLSVLPRVSCLAALLALNACALLGRGSTPIDRSEDPRIQREVEARLAREPALDAGAIRVEVNGRVVRLHGSVRGIGAWYCASTSAELVEGVRTVVNDLSIQRGPREVQCSAPRPAPVSTGGGVTGGQLPLTLEPAPDASGPTPESPHSGEPS